MPIRLKNRFFPETHQTTDALVKIKNQSYESEFNKPILPKDTAVVPILALADYSILLGYLEDGEFAGWIEKKQRAELRANPSYPEAPIIELILNSVNVYPDPKTILDRIIKRLIDIQNSKKRNI